MYTYIFCIIFGIKVPVPPSSLSPPPPHPPLPHDPMETQAQSTHRVRTEYQCCVKTSILNAWPWEML